MIEDIIRQVPLFSALPPEEIRYLATTLRQSELPAGEVLFLEGDVGDRFYIVLEGQVDIIKALGSEEQRLLSEKGSGDFIGEMSLLFPDGLRSASVRSHNQVKLLEMTHADFDALLHRQPLLALQILRELSLRMRDSENATVRDLQEKNRQLAEAYRDLQAAQAQLIEKEKLEHELQMARKIQENILPKVVPVIPGWELAAHWQPARSVSGDFYDFIKFTEGSLGLLIADVTGKGMPAALVMATTRSVIRTVLEQVAQPGEVLEKVNDLLCRDMPAKMFVTCLYALLDPASGRLRFANAGHDLPFQRKRDRVVELRATGLPLGLMPGVKYDEKETFLDNGDWVLLTSDGLVEAHNPQREMFGVPRLGRLLSSLRGEMAQSQGPALIGFLLRQLAEFTGPGWEQEDDVTLVTLERSP
jgi:serine phosphatase RsbU (regulator of sigma subunit)